MTTTVLRRLTSFGNQCCDYNPIPQHFQLANTPLEVYTFLPLVTYIRILFVFWVCYR
jgi:hypothetical protein